MKTNLNYCIVLSSEQLSYLAGSKYGIDRMKILHRLIEAAVLKETKYAIKGFSTTLQVGQAILSEVDLSSKLGYDKKTISRVLDKMNQLGIVATTQSNRTSVQRENVPVIPEEGELLSLSSFPSVSVPPQPAAEEESDEGIPTDNMA